MNVISDISAQEAARFLGRIKQGDDCWTWTGELNNQGYGVFPLYRGGRRRLLAHRVAYYLATRTDPGGLVIRHDCDNPPCVNPDHLQAGTQADNMRDAALRGRANYDGLKLGRTGRKRRLRQRLAVSEKRCPSCGETKHVEDYHRNRSSHDGWQTYCKACKNAQERALRARAPKRPPVPCGTETAYRRHLKADETPCEPCRAANRIAARVRQQRRRIGAQLVDQIERRVS